jgi:hypothetical protein
MEKFLVHVIYTGPINSQGEYEFAILSTNCNYPVYVFARDPVAYKQVKKISLSLFIGLILSLGLILFLGLSLSLGIRLSLGLSLSLSLSLSLFIDLILSLGLSLFLGLSLA